MTLFGKLNIRKKMLLTFIPLTLLPMVILIAIAYSMFRSQMEGYAGDRIYESVFQVSRHLDSYLEELDRLSMLPYYQPTLLSIMNERNESDLLDLYYKTKTVESFLSQSMINPREDLRDVFLYRSDGKVFFISRGSVQLNEHYDYRRSFWYNKALDGNGKTVFLSRYPDDRFANPTEDFFSVTRLIKSYDQNVLGAILIDADYSGLAALLSKVDLGKTANLVVLDEDNRVVYRQNDLYMPYTEMAALEAASSGKLEIREGKVLAAFSRSAMTGWKVVGLVSAEELNRDIRTMRSMIVMLSLCMVAAAGIASFFLSRGISSPLIRLKSLMKEVQRGNFKVSMPVTKNEDEVGIVSAAFNNMSGRIEELIHEVSEVKVKQKEAELNQLKAQIRPHFLYNTLESIRALADLKDHYEIADVTSSLGNLLRYSIESRDGLVAIGEELRQAQNYLKIQQVCSRYPVYMTVDIDDSILRAYTIPILMQPIIENSVRHGFEGLARAGRIFVSARRQGGDILLEIADDGRGMPAAAAVRLNEALTAAETDASSRQSNGFGIGLLNVASRLRLIFGEPYGMMIASEQNEGTTVLMRLPYIANPHGRPNRLLREGGRNAPTDDRG